MKVTDNTEALKQLASKVFGDTLSDFQHEVHKAATASGKRHKLKRKYEFIMGLTLDTFENEYELIKAKKSTQPKSHRDLIVYLYAQAQARYWELFNKEKKEDKNIGGKSYNNND